jgi:hypothetical protein
MRCIWYSAFGVKIPAHAWSLHPCPPTPHTPHIPHPRYSHHALCHWLLSRVSTECSAFGFRFWGPKSLLLLDLTCLLACFLNACSCYLIYITYSTLITHSTPRCTSLCPGQILYKCIIVRFSIYGTNNANLQYSWSWSGSSSHIPTYWTLYISPLDESEIQGRDRGCARFEPQSQLWPILINQL